MFGESSISWGQSQGYSPPCSLHIHPPCYIMQASKATAIIRAVIINFQLAMSGSNAKGQLQEWFQREGLQAPTYAVKSWGPSNSPTFVCTVTVRLRSGEERSECVQIRGGKKKDAEHLAARKMIRNLQEGPGDSGRASSNHSRSVSSPRRRPDVSSSPSPPTLTPPTTGVSQVKILQERLQAEGSPLPQYTEVASRSPNMAFKVRCVLFNSRKQPVIETQGEGRNKKSAKENAALKMLTKLRVAPDPHGVGGKTTPDPPNSGRPRPR